MYLLNVFYSIRAFKNIIDAKFLVLSGDYPKALAALDQSPPMAFELAELQRIEIFLAENEADRALTHLEFLYQHQLSPWLQEIETAYQQRLTALWGN